MLAWLVGFAVAWAWDGPRVPEEALAAVPPDVYAGWVEREQELASLDRRIDEARASLVADAAPDAADDLRAMERSELETKRIAYARAKLVLDAALEEEDAARLGLRLARQRGDRSEIAEARRRVSRAVDQRGEARRQLAEARRSRDQVRREALARVPPAPETEALAPELVDHPVMTEAELARLVARRDVLAAELERDQAAAANRSGAKLDLAPFEEALARAHAAEVSARTPEG